MGGDHSGLAILTEKIPRDGDSTVLGLFIVVTQSMRVGSIHLRHVLCCFHRSEVHGLVLEAGLGTAAGD